MIFLDASATIAILTREPGYENLIEALARAKAASTSPIAVCEAALGLRRKRKCAVEEAEADVMDFLRESRVDIVGIDPEAARLALAAFSRFGKGIHPAQLNMGDCFAYAQAKAAQAALLFKGDDFSKTDIKAAV